MQLPIQFIKQKSLRNSFPAFEVNDLHHAHDNSTMLNPTTGRPTLKISPLIL